MSALWANIPQEMRKRNQWAICSSDYEDKAPRGLNKRLISVVEPNEWLSFEEAAAKAHEYGWKIGYIISKDDPFVCFDLDVKDAENCGDPAKWTNKNIHDIYWQAIRTLDSYTEYSTSGKGYHIWVKGHCRSCRRNGIEVYSGERFIICTGNVISNVPIANRQDILDKIEEETKASEQDQFELEEVEEDESDSAVIERAMRSSTGLKFNALAAGHWHSYGYPSQSEADLALIGMIAFFTKSNEQVRRIFRMTELGKRDKATKNNVYLDRTLKRVRAKQKAEALVQDNEIDFSDLIEKANSIEVAPPQIEAGPFEPTPPLAASVALAAPVSELVKNAPKEGIDWPPGLAGRIAHFMYNAAPRPVKEVAIVSTLGLLAGVCGKAFSIPLSGLNLYIILVARSAVGKEAMHSSVGLLAASLSNVTPHINNYLSFTDFVSGPALLKEVIQNPSICNIAGEWGQKLMHIAQGETQGGPLATLRKEMTNLYQKSGSTSIVGGMSYSDKDKNIASVTGVAYSMIGETTPETFYSSVTPSMMADGFMSRFLTIEYKGERPPLNKNQITVPDHSLIDSLGELVDRATEVLGEGQTVPVTRRKDAEAIIDEFEAYCDGMINSTDDESRRQMWNRASLKALRVAALIAVADGWHIPVIRVDHIQWAIQLVLHGIQMMEERIATGDVGVSDNTRERKVIAIMRDYLMRRPTDGYKIIDEIYDKRIITRAYISQRLGRHSAFESHRMGSGRALDITLEHLVSNGILIEVDKATLVDKMNVRGRAYQIVHLNY